MEFNHVTNKAKGRPGVHHLLRQRDARVCVPYDNDAENFNK
jgi:hypothetical protein